MRLWFFDSGGPLWYNGAMADEMEMDLEPEGDEENSTQMLPRETAPDTNLMRLTFAKEYIACGGNATEAAKRAGYKGSRRYLTTIGSRLLKAPDIRHYVTAHLRNAMDAREVVARLTDIARGSIVDFLTIDPETGQPHVDFRSHRAQESMHLIKELKPTKFGYEIKMYSKLEALELLVRVFRMDQQEIDRKKVLAQAIEDMPENIREPFKQLLANFTEVSDIPGVGGTDRESGHRTLGTDPEIVYEPPDDEDMA